MEPWIFVVLVIALAVWIRSRRRTGGLMCASCGRPIRGSAQVQHGGTVYHARCSPTLAEADRRLRRSWK